MVKRARQAIISSLIFLVSTPLMALEEPKYTVIESAAPFELRQYAPMIIAEVTVDGDMSEDSFNCPVWRKSRYAQPRSCLALA